MRFADMWDRKPTIPAPAPPVPAPREATTAALPADPGPPPAPAPRTIEPPPSEVTAGALTVLRQTKGAILQDQPLPLSDLRQAAEALSAAVGRHSPAFVEIALGPASDEEPLLAHLCHTAILAAILGTAARYTADRLPLLTLATFLHDIGMVRVLSLADQPRALTAEERTQLQQHPRHAEQFLKTVPDLPRVVLAVAAQAHERLDGSGYPAGLRGGEIVEEARLVGVACSFESWTHPRPHRPAFTALETISRLTSTLRGAFDPRFVKLLIEQIGFYPMGSWVELSTGEQGRVNAVNPGSPLRPTVEIVDDLYGVPLPQVKRVDLLSQPTLHVARALGAARPARARKT